MSQEEHKIKIRHAHTQGGGDDGEDLKNCYFLPTNEGNSYVFFDRTGTPIATTPMPIHSKGSFTFKLSGHSFEWRIPNPDLGSEPFQIDEGVSPVTVSGSWRNDDTLRAASHPSPGSDPTGESGTFAGQAGQPVDPEDKDAAAAAKA